MDVETVFAVWIILLVVVFAQAFLTHHLCRMLSASHARERHWSTQFNLVIDANNRLKATCDRWECIAKDWERIAKDSGKKSA